MSLFEKIKSSYWGECAALSWLAAWDTANNLIGTVLAAYAAMIHPLAIFNGISDSVKSQNALLTLAVYTIFSWLFFFVFRMIFVAPYRLYREKQKQIESLEKSSKETSLREKEISAQETLADAINRQAYSTERQIQQSRAVQGQESLARLLGKLDK